MNYRASGIPAVLSRGIPGEALRAFQLGVQSWSPFVTRKSGHIWQIWAEMTQMLMPKSTKVAQIHLSECNSAKFPPKFAKFPPNFRQNSPNFRQNSAKIRQISQISFHKRALTLNTQISGVFPEIFPEFLPESPSDTGGTLPTNFYAVNYKLFWEY